MKAACPPGTYGTAPGLYDEACSGFCPAGAACLGGTVNPVYCEESFYATGGAVACSACPGRRINEGERCRNSRNCCL